MTTTAGHMKAPAARKEREAPEVAAAVTRLLVALARRAGNGELEALEALDELQAQVKDQLAVAVTGYRTGPAQASWEAIGHALGMTRQSAHERWGHHG